MHPSAHPSSEPSTRDIPPWMVRAAAVATTVALLAASLPLILAAVSASLGLVALVLLGLGGSLLFQAMPWAMQRLENRLLKLRKAEARANPVEQLENDVLRRSERLVAFRQALASVGGQIASIRQMVDERRHLDPAHALEHQQRALQKLTDFYGANLVRLEQAQAALEQFRTTVARKKTEWEIAHAIHTAARLLDPQAAQTLVQDLLTDEALRTVQNRFNTVFAELDIQMRSVDAPTRPLVASGHFDPLAPLTLPVPATAGSIR